MHVHYRQGDSLPLKGDSLRIPPGPQKGLPSSAVVIGDTYDNKFVDHMLLIMTSPLSFFYHMFLAMKSPLSFLYKCIDNNIDKSTHRWRHLWLISASFIANIF